jgi:serine/threonine protein kinase
VNPSRVIGGRYVVLAELERGGTGVVWRAEDRVTGRLVAVRELHLPKGLTPTERSLFRERLLREARSAGRLDHPGIVTVHDVVTDEGPDKTLTDHIVMDLIEAPTLAEVVATEGPIGERTAQTVGQQALCALRAAHDSGVVHGDIGPGAVLLGVDGQVALTGFGIAQAVDDPALTVTGYLAPERREGAAATPESDLWALGATLFFAVQGAGPCDRSSAAASAEAPPTRCRGPLGSVIAGLLMRSPQARLTAAQAAALLAASGSVEAPDVAVAPVSRRCPWLWVAVAAGLALAAGAFAGAALLDGPERTVTTLTYGGRGPPRVRARRPVLPGRPADPGPDDHRRCDRRLRRTARAGGLPDSRRVRRAA